MIIGPIRGIYDGSAGLPLDTVGIGRRASNAVMSVTLSVGQSQFPSFHDRNAALQCILSLPLARYYTEAAAGSTVDACPFVCLAVRCQAHLRDPTQVFSRCSEQKTAHS
jgi:hypothetical protein